MRAEAVTSRIPDPNASFSGRRRDAMSRVALAARRAGIPLFLVGGAVRDLILLGSAKDLDLVVEGDAARFVRSIAKSENIESETWPRFRTGTLVFPGELRVDIACARRETYERPGALPAVSPGTIDQDLGRRDFTVNAMALPLRIDNNGALAFGKISDPFAGREDLRHGRIRILHPDSFRDDPTRIFRALRFAARFDFRLERDTARLAEELLRDGGLDTVSAARLGKEMRLLMDEPRRAAAVSRAVAPGLPGGLAPGMAWDAARFEKLDKQIEKIVKELRALQTDPQAKEPDIFLLRLAALLDGNKPNVVARCADRLALKKREAAAVVRGAAAPEDVRRIIDAGGPPSEIGDALDQLEPEAALLLAAKESGNMRTMILNHVATGGAARLEISGADLIAAGFRPSKAFGDVLREVARRKADGAVDGRRDELRIAVKLLRGRPRK